MWRGREKRYNIICNIISMNLLKWDNKDGDIGIPVKM